MSFKSVFKWLTLLALLALLAGLFWPPIQDSPAAWVGLLIFFPLTAGPLALPFVLSSGDTEGRARAGYFMFFLAAAAWTAWTLHGVWTSQSSTAGLGLVFLPLYTWTGLIAAGFVIAAVTGYRPSLSRPAGSPPRQSPPPG